MPKIMLHNSEARHALARGVHRLAAAVEPTLGPKGLNAMIDRPVGTPLITRDGVSIASEIELPDRFENMGAQVAREVSMQTNEVAGDGTTTAIVLADALVQAGVAATDRGAKAVDLCKGIAQHVDARPIGPRLGRLLGARAGVGAPREVVGEPLDRAPIPLDQLPGLDVLAPWAAPLRDDLDHVASLSVSLAIP
jgi:hypothetical protein